MWQILQFHIHEQQPSITQLQVHLPGQHMVTFDPNKDVEAVQQWAASEQTTLTTFFNANTDLGALGVEACHHTYQEFPQYFTWKPKEKVWALCQRGYALGHMYYVSPTSGERFYLWMLLTIVKGPTSFAHLRTFNGILCPTFHDACIAHGLLKNDGEWQQCLEEASAMQTGHQLHQLFCTMLLFCSPADPEALWMDFWQHICDDLWHYLITNLQHNNPIAEDVYDYGLYLLDQLLSALGHTLTAFSMPWHQHNWGAVLDRQRDL